MAIRIVCSGCQAKLDIREEFAGTKRRCPKCKTEFSVPVPDDAEDGVVIAEDDPVPEPPPSVAVKPAAAKPKPELPSPAAARPVMKTLPAQDDDDDEDYIPSFVTASAGDDRKTPLPPVPAKAAVEDEEPVLAIPKIAPSPKPKFKTFDDFDADEPASVKPAARQKLPTPAPANRQRDRLSDEFDLDPPSPPPKARRSSSDFDRPTPARSSGLSDSSIPASGGSKDRAQAARELRQALKDNSLRPQTEQESGRGFNFDFSGLWSEIGLKGVAIVLGTVPLLGLAFYFGSAMIGGGPKLPPMGYVTGTVTYNGAPVAGAMVNFQPILQEGQTAGDLKARQVRASFGMTDGNGKYQLMYMEGVPGVGLGNNRVMIQLPPPLVVPAEYSMMSVTMKEVKSGSQTYDFPLTGPAPRK